MDFDKDIFVRAPHLMHLEDIERVLWQRLRTIAESGERLPNYKHISLYFRRSDGSKWDGGILIVWSKFNVGERAATRALLETMHWKKHLPIQLLEYVPTGKYSSVDKGSPSELEIIASTD